MKKLTGCLVCVMLSLGWLGPVLARPLGGDTPAAPAAPAADPVFAARTVARQQLRPLVAVLHLNERQVLAIEELLVAEALAPGAMPARSNTLRLLYAAAQLDSIQPSAGSK